MKRFERANGLDTALYKNYLYLYLIDTGAEVSVLPPRSEDRDRYPINNMHLQAAIDTQFEHFDSPYFVQAFHNV